MPVLNDMGGSRLDVSENIASTLRAQDHGHPPIVLDRPLSSGGFCTEHSADSRGIGYEEERAPTLRAGVVPGVAIEYNPTDSRIKLNKDGICQTLCRRCGTGGNQTPLAMVPRAFGIGSDQSQGMQSEGPVSMKRKPAAHWTAVQIPAAGRAESPWWSLFLLRRISVTKSAISADSPLPCQRNPASISRHLWLSRNVLPIP